jgi:hypothetical protein
MLKQFMTSETFYYLLLLWSWHLLGERLSAFAVTYVLLQPIVANLFIPKSGEGLAKEWKSAANSAMLIFN